MLLVENEAGVRKAFGVDVAGGTNPAITDPAFRNSPPLFPNAPESDAAKVFPGAVWKILAANSCDGKRS